MKKLIAIILLLSIGTAMATTTNPNLTVNVLPGLETYILLKLNTTDVLAGINGEFDFDPSKFSSPSVSVFGYNATFICQGNVVSPGHYRFVVYGNPTRNLNTSTPILYFRLLVSPSMAPGTTSNATYSMEAVSDPNGVSLPVSLTGVVTIKAYQARNAASEWAIYE